MLISIILGGVKESKRINSVVQNVTLNIKENKLMRLENVKFVEQNLNVIKNPLKDFVLINVIMNG